MKNSIFKLLKIKIFIAALVFAAFLSGCEKVTFPSDPKDATTLRIIATSDLHGKFMPWEYATDSENDYGSLAQLSSAIKDIRIVILYEISCIKKQGVISAVLFYCT